MGMTIRNRERGKAKLREESQRDDQVRRGGLSEQGKQGVWPEVCTYVNTGVCNTPCLESFATS